MTWAHGDDYMRQKNAELKHLLLLRRLPHSGNKEKMASRLVAHDEHHPFPFQRLPAELRNEIYKLASDWNDSLLSRGRELPKTGHTESIACFESFENIMIHSSLFRTCKQTRAEGLALFYQYHVFVFFVEHSGCFLAILRWLQKIGHLGRSNIRRLSVRFLTKCCGQDKGFMDCIHEMLSEEATVAYIPEFPDTLWRIGQLYYLRNPAKVPFFRIDGQNPDRTLYIEEQFTNYGFRPPWPYYASYDWLEYRMVFFPRQSWFGPSNSH